MPAGPSATLSAAAGPACRALRGWGVLSCAPYGAARHRGGQSCESPCSSTCIVQHVLHALAAGDAAPQAAAASCYFVCTATGE